MTETQRLHTKILATQLQPLADKMVELGFTETFCKMVEVIESFIKEFPTVYNKENGDASAKLST